MEVSVFWSNKPNEDKMKKAKSPVPMGTLKGQFSPWVNPRLWWVEGHSVGQKPMNRTLKLKTADNNRCFFFTEVISSDIFQPGNKSLCPRPIGNRVNPFFQSFWEGSFFVLCKSLPKLGEGMALFASSAEET